MDDVSKWQTLKGKLSVEQFERQHPGLYLVKRRSASSGATASSPILTSAAAAAAAAAAPVEEVASDFTEKMGFATDVVDPDDVPRQTRTSGGQPLALVYVVAKAPGNPYLDRISVGRARNCDIVVRDGSVSKLHAHMRIV